jgi:hypothetical protein
VASSIVILRVRNQRAEKVRLSRSARVAGSAVAWLFARFGVQTVTATIGKRGALYFATSGRDDEQQIED